ncbi:MAG: rRNA maturation RNase YbeY [Planctomyces sp.]|jgi:probable rRNA maturation factor|nr:rRNA maturation RNase YbeY [Planctomyces sp.]
MPWEIDIVSQQSAHPVNTDLLHTAVAVVLQQEQLISAILSISIVDNAAIHRINRQYLQHDYPTDVISFQLGFDDAELPPQDSDEQDETDSDGALTVAAPETPLAAGAAIEGEIIASAEMAVQMAPAGNWSADAELALYVVHGLLHLCGYDDLTPDDRSLMKSREILAMNALGFHPAYAEDQPDS